MTRSSRLVLTLLLAGCLCLLMPAMGQAYIGPGAGLSAIGSLLALLAAVAVAIFGFLWFPIKSYRRKRRRAAEAAKSGPEVSGPEVSGSEVAGPEMAGPEETSVEK